MDNANTNREEQLKKALHHLMSAGRHLEKAGLSPVSEQENASIVAAIPDEMANTDCVILTYSNFAQMVENMIELGDMVDTLSQMLGAKEHLARTLLGVACKLDTSVDEKKEKQYIHDRTDEIMNKWSNATLTAVNH